MTGSQTLTHNLVGIALGVVLTALSYVVAFTAGWITELNNVEFFAVVTSYWCTYLCVVQSRWNYPLGVITTLTYAYLFYQWGLYASMLTNIYLPFALLYGWFRWGPDGRTRPVTHTAILDWVGLYIPLVAVSFIVVLFALSFIGATLPLPDTIILILTILAQWLLDNKKLETWFVWMAVNVAAIYVYSTSGLYIAAFQYVFFLANAFYGYFQWRQSMKPSVA